MTLLFIAIPICAFYAGYKLGYRKGAFDEAWASEDLFDTKD